MTDALRAAYVDALVERLKSLYRLWDVAGTSEWLITSADGDEVHDLQKRIERLLWGEAGQAIEVHILAAAKRPNGAGSIYQRKDRRWVASIMRAGRRLSRYASTEAEAATALSALVHEGPPETGVSVSDASGADGASVYSSPAPSPDTGLKEEALPEKEGVLPEELIPECAPSDSEIAPSISEMHTAPSPGVPQSEPAVGVPRNLCIDDCGKGVSGPGKRCQSCNAKNRWADRRDARTKADGLIGEASRAKGIAIPPRVEPAPVEPAVASIEPCICAAKLAVLARGNWHEKDCPWHAHRWQLPAASDGPGVWLATCACGATKEHRPYGVEDEARAELAHRLPRDAKTAPAEVQA